MSLLYEPTAECIHWWKLDSMQVGVCLKCDAERDFYRTLAEEAAVIGYGRSKRKYVKPRHRNDTTGRWKVGNPKRNP